MKHLPLNILVILGSPPHPPFLGRRRTSDARLRPVRACELGTTITHPALHARVHAYASLCMCGVCLLSHPSVTVAHLDQLKRNPPWGLSESKCANKSTCKYTNMRIHLNTCVCTQISSHTHTHTQTYAHICMCKRARTSEEAWSCTHTHTPALRSVSSCVTLRTPDCFDSFFRDLHVHAFRNWPPRNSPS